MTKLVIGNYYYVEGLEPTNSWYGKKVKLENIFYNGTRVNLRHPNGYSGNIEAKRLRPANQYANEVCDENT